jgi:hypothetical protein
LLKDAGGTSLTLAAAIPGIAPPSDNRFAEATEPAPAFVLVPIALAVLLALDGIGGITRGDRERVVDVCEGSDSKAEVGADGESENEPRLLFGLLPPLMLRLISGTFG